MVEFFELVLIVGPVSFAIKEVGLARKKEDDGLALKLALYLCIRDSPERPDTTKNRGEDYSLKYRGRNAKVVEQFAHQGWIVALFAHCPHRIEVGGHLHETEKGSRLLFKLPGKVVSQT